VEGPSTASLADALGDWFAASRPFPLSARDLFAMRGVLRKAVDA